MKVFKISMATSKKSGAYIIDDLKASKAFYTELNNSTFGSAFPELPPHILQLPRKGHFEDFIIGDLWTPYVSERVMNLLEHEARGEYEFMPVGQLGDEHYFILVVRPGSDYLDLEKSVYSPFYISKHVFHQELIKDAHLFRIKNYSNALYCTEKFIEFILKHNLTGIYARELNIYLSEDNPFGLPIMKGGYKAILS